MPAEGAIKFDNFGAVLNSDQGAETVSTADLLQAMSLVQHELEEAEVRTLGHGQYARTLWQRTLLSRKVGLHKMYGRTRRCRR